jgi:hypothetical protein
MPTTLGDAIYYPPGNLPPNVPLQMQLAAESVQAALNKIKSGSITIAMGAGVSVATQVVTFDEAYTVVPQVGVTMTSNVTGRASLLQFAAISKTVNGFTAKLQTSDNANIGTSYNITLDWIAVGQ